MQLDGETELRATPEAVWEAVHDTEILKHCVPGCEKIEWLDETTLEAALLFRAAAFSRHFSSRVHIRDAVRPESYTLHFGKSLETASVTSRVRFEPSPAGTKVFYEVEARLDGSIARFGVKLISGVARKMAKSFFACLDKRMSEEAS
ncbi:MAG: CoxG family protein [Gammaproteobacteria bacterium]